MSDISQKIKMSKDAGFSDKEVLDFLGQFPEFKEKVTLSRKMGQNDTDIVNFLSTMPGTPNEQLMPMDVPALFAKGAAESVYDLATAPYAALGGDTSKLRKDIFRSAPSASGPIGELAEGAGKGMGAAIPGLGVGRAIEEVGTKLASPVAKTIGKFMTDAPKTQVTAGAVGGAVDESSGTPGAGVAASAAVPLIASAGRKIANPNLGHLTGDQLRLRQLAENLGIPLTAGDKTGNKVLHQGEAVLRTLPGSSGVMQEADKVQRESFNRAVLDVAGINDKYATPSTLDTSHRALGKELTNLAQQSTATLDRQFATEVDAVRLNMGRRLSTDQAPVFKSYIDDLDPYLMAARAGPPAPALSGEEYDEIRKGIARRMRQSKDPALKDALGGLVDALDGAMERSSPPQLKARWDDARRRYSALMTIEDAMSRGTQADRETGNIPFAGLKVAASAGDRRGYARGRGQFNDLARIGEFIAPKVGTSGTSERTNMMRILKGGAIPAAATYGLTTGDFVTPGLAIGLPYGAAKAYQTDAVTDWLTRQSINNKGLVRTLLEGLQAGIPQVTREMTEQK